MGKINLVKKGVDTIKNDGVEACARKAKKYLKKIVNERNINEQKCKDVLFISGCGEDLPHPWRYRVKHQREQLEAFGFSTDEVYYVDLMAEQALYYQIFIFFRCPCTSDIEKFVEKIRTLNKKIIYDIDDLVIDTKYTDMIKYVSAMPENEKNAYDANVMSMQNLLKKCDMAITSTECLAEELKGYLPDVYINRNTASEEMIQLSRKAFGNCKKNREIIKIGYFSGSITHNADFELIMPVLKSIMEKHHEVELCLAGELDIPDELMTVKDRIRRLPFCDWKKLPGIIGDMDINLAPLEDTIFNRAKSENKWVEAALVKVVTVASDVGAFHDCIEDGKTGVLCKNTSEWERSLNKLVTDKEYRLRLGEQAFAYCMEHCTTIKNGFGLAQIISEELPDNYVFVLPGLEISGGIKVALKHASILQKNGKNVILFVLSGEEHQIEFENRIFPVINLEKMEICCKVRHMIATMWTTVKFVEEYPNAANKYYLVQNFETDFYREGDPIRIEANRSYMPGGNIRFLTISKWCQNWLKSKYGHDSLYAPNGIDISNFKCHKRKKGEKIRILVEGDCAVDYKNVDEAFEITNGLEEEQYEIWYMSYNASPKQKYRVDRFFHKVPYDQVPDIYSQCDILLKTSLLESFSYPPLEMMATGGYVVAILNEGNREYLKDGVNCVCFEHGEIKKAREIIQSLFDDTTLCDKLYVNGRLTAEARDWHSINNRILRLYGIE